MALELRATPYEQHRNYVLAVLSRRCGWLADDEREAIFHDAYTLLLEKERDDRLEPEAMHPRQLRAYLTQTAINKALDDGKRAERNRTEPLGDRALAEPDSGTAPDELAAESLDSVRMREIVAELPERRQAIVKLRFYFDRTPEEIQSFLGVSERAYRRDLERALRQISEAYQLVREDRFCESRRSMILAFVAGIAGPQRAQRAREHLAGCPGCAHWAGQLREAAGRAAAVLPMPEVALDHGPLTRLAESATMLLARADAATPQYVAAARPGNVAAVVASCIAISSGATYCVVEGLPDPLNKLGRPAAALRSNAKPSEAKPAAETTPEPSPAPVQPPPVDAPSQDPQPEAVPAAPTPQPQDQEFGVEESGPPALAVPAPRQPPSNPSPPPSSGPGEFGL